jgi:hypothetical protein
MQEKQRKRIHAQLGLLKRSRHHSPSLPITSTNVDKVITYTSGAESVKTYVITNTKTGTPAQRSFCSNCGSPLAIRTDIQPGRVFIPSGTFDDKALRNQVPLLENFVEDRVSWMGEVAENQISGSK